MKNLLVLILLLSLKTYDTIQVAKFINSKGCSTLSIYDLEIIYRKIEKSNFEVRKVVIKEMQWGIQGEVFYVYAFYEKQIINYVFYRMPREHKLKLGRSLIVEVENDCFCTNHEKIMDDVNRIDIYILPYYNSEFLIDSAKHEVCQSMIPSNSPPK